MSILQEVLTWSATLPAWQSDAVARLVSKQALAPGDLDDIYALLKAANGIPDPKSRVASPLTSDQIPAQATATTTVELRAIKNLVNVNAIAEKQVLPIAPLGLTVIYGENGSGKSGYSRVLKRACRARDRQDAIHPNATLPAGKAGVPEADFEVSVNGSIKDVHWSQGKTAPPELSSLAVFDSRCARSYLDQEDDFSYVPYGLDVFGNLAKVCNQLKSLAEGESAASQVDLSAFSPLLGDTVVGKTIASLSAKSSIDHFKTLGSVTAEELAHHAVLAQSLKVLLPT